MTNAQTLLYRLQTGANCSERGDRCRVLNAESGCDCAAAADEIERLSKVVKEHCQPPTAALSMAYADNDRLRAELTKWRERALKFADGGPVQLHSISVSERQQCIDQAARLCPKCDQNWISGAEECDCG